MSLRNTTHITTLVLFFSCFFPIFDHNCHQSYSVVTETWLHDTKHCSLKFIVLKDSCFPQDRSSTRLLFIGKCLCSVFKNLFYKLYKYTLPSKKDMLLCLCTFMHGLYWVTSVHVCSESDLQVMLHVQRSSRCFDKNKPNYTINIKSKDAKITNLMNIIFKYTIQRLDVRSVLCSPPFRPTTNKLCCSVF